MSGRNAVIDWLLDSDPAIRWQVMRDIVAEPDDIVAYERSRVANEGWGARLLGRQTVEGHWGDDQRHGWMTTNDALALLKDFGADPASDTVRGAIDLLVDRVTWRQLDGRPFFEGETEACINGRILGSSAYFGKPNDKLADRLLSEQLEDGGWNCEAPNSKRSSFHSTICVLEGLLEYERARGANTALTEAQRRGQDYLLERRMFRSMRSGEVINERWTKFSFPTGWHYDVLRGLDYLRNANVSPDERVSEAAEIVVAGRGSEGRWPLDAINPDSDRLSFDMGGGVGEACRWITLRALRVLKWYQERADA